MFHLLFTNIIVFIFQKSKGFSFSCGLPSLPMPSFLKRSQPGIDFIRIPY